MNSKLLFLILIIVASVYPQDQKNQFAPVKKAKIEKLLETTSCLNAVAVFEKTILDQMQLSFKKMKAPVSDTVLKIMEKEIGTVISDEMKLKGGLVDQLVVIYDKNFSEKNIDDMLLFFGSETGKKVLATLPDILPESLDAGRAWGAKMSGDIAQKLMERMTKKGIMLPLIR
jgi:uncharacterized protein